jgi:hypothetical protein
MRHWMKVVFGVHSLTFDKKKLTGEWLAVFKFFERMEATVRKHQKLILGAYG